MAGDVRERMISGAVRLLARQGLQGTSFAEVLQLTGAPRGSVYHHFPGGKDQLVAAAVDAAGGQALTILDGLAGAPADQVAETFLGLWRLLLQRTDCTMGCAVLAVTVATGSPELLDKAAAVFRTWRTRLADLLDQGGLPGAAGHAVTLVAAAEGAVVLSRAERSIEPFDAVAAQLLGQLRQSMTR
ncbi:MAG: TetR/AcrR family transcriptional regulator, lmrAB and yxaGH operons repressor [Actinoplanes sp.]|jgi:AcrR family transcriptional regulator|nr:TetR/AcrR family transcriptional regulator, lmrAB and yxaGH operons repressor [Actinoplanes sp.]